jgi:hypothetical protein
MLWIPAAPAAVSRAVASFSQFEGEPVGVCGIHSGKVPAERHAVMVFSLLARTARASSDVSASCLIALAAPCVADRQLPVPLAGPCMASELAHRAA